MGWNTGLVSQSLWSGGQNFPVHSTKRIVCRFHCFMVEGSELFSLTSRVEDGEESNVPRPEVCTEKGNWGKLT